MRRIVGREVTRAKNSSPSFFPTSTVADLPLASVTVNEIPGFARPYFARLSGVSLAIVVILLLATEARKELMASPSPGALLGIVNFQASLSLAAASSPDGFLRSNEVSSGATKCRTE